MGFNDQDQLNNCHHITNLYVFTLLVKNNLF